MSNDIGSPQNRRILIVEDEEGIAIHLGFLLTRMGYTPLKPVTTGEEAIEHAGEQKPDLVLMDIHLASHMSGLDAARQIREIHDIPSIFLSAIAPDQTILQTPDNQPYAYLVKPVKEPDLRAAIEITLYRHKMEARLLKSEEQLRESYHRLEQGLRQMKILHNIDQAITTHSDYSSMASAILSELVSPGEVDAAVLFIPNLPGSGRVRGTGPLGLLRMAGLAGLPESTVDSSVMNWQMALANQVFQSCKPCYITDLQQENDAGAETLQRVAGFHTFAALPLIAHHQVKGVLEFFLRKIDSSDGDWKTFLQSLALQTAIGMDHVEMLESLKRSNRELALAYDETIKGWAQALELREKEDRGHAERVSELSVRLASAMGMSGDTLDNMRRGAFLHDIGKMAVPDSILYKTGPLNGEEWVTMRQHPTVGYRMLSGIEYLKPALDVVYCHHEKWDGSGYPRGLKGDEIPLSARIFAVIDVWDALTNDRPYRLAWPDAEVRAYMREQAGKHFEPNVVDTFLKII
jgi:putative nucleotidyltransferase with HDIG domain